MPSSQRKKSFVWKHYHISKEDESIAICNFCGVERKRGTDTRNYSTSTLAAHLKRCAKYRLEMGSAAELPENSARSGYGVKKGEKSLETNMSLKKKKRKIRHSDAAELPSSKVSCEDSQEDVICSRQMDLVHSGTVMHSLYKQHLSGNLCDLTLISAASSGNDAPESLLVDAMPQKKFTAHSSVLSALSSKIRALIEMGSRTIEMKDVTAFGLQCLLEIVYTGRIKKNILVCHQDIHQVWKAARDLDLQYALDYIEEEFPQSMRWIVDEELQGHEDKEENIQEDEDDLIDLCAQVTDAGAEESEMENPDQMEEKRKEESVVEITFTK